MKVKFDTRLVDGTVVSVKAIIVGDTVVIEGVRQKSDQKPVLLWKLSPQDRFCLKLEAADQGRVKENAS